MKEPDESPEERMVNVTSEKQTRMRLLTGGVAASGFATILAYITLDKMSWELSTSLYFLIAALPFHLRSLFHTILIGGFSRLPDSAYLRIGIVNSLGLILSYFGFVFLFLHFGILYGLIFIVASSLASFGTAPMFKHYSKGTEKIS